MRILHLIHQFAPERRGGAERHLLQLAKAQNKKHDILIYTQSVDHQGADATHESVEGLPVRRFLDRSPKARYTLQRDLLNTAREFHPDLVHIHHGIGFGADTLKKLTKAHPTIITLHDYWWMCPQVRLLFRSDTPCPGPKPSKRCSDCYKGVRAGELTGEASLHFERGLLAPFFKLSRYGASRAYDNDTNQSSRSLFTKFLGGLPPLRKSFFKARMKTMKSIFRQTKVFISPSQYLAKRYNEAGLPLPENKLCFIPYGIDENEFAPCENPATKPPFRFALIGHLNRGKGVDLAIGAFREISADSATLHLYGDADLSRQSEEIVGRRSKQIFLHGPFEPGQAASIFKNIDALILPSIWVENAPKVLHEAFGAGVPVIASDHGSLPEFVGQGRGGMLFKAHDALNLRSLIKEIAANPEKLAIARDTIPAPVGIDKSARMIEDIYKEIIS
jgi:glycosyltransferase involved in cell wall biosynthesis